MTSDKSADADLEHQIGGSGRHMYEAGFSIINYAQNSSLYIIPGEAVTTGWIRSSAAVEPNRFSTEYRLRCCRFIPDRWQEQSIACGNDTIENLDAGIMEEGMLERFMEPLPLLWKSFGKKA